MITVVTGGAGFIGSNLVKVLVKQGREVVVLDNLCRGTKRNLRGVKATLISTDLRDYATLKLVLAGMDIDTIFHLAAMIGNEDYLHGGTVSDMDILQYNNAIDSNVFRAVSRLGNIPAIVYASSSAVYPVRQQMRLGAVLNETLPVRIRKAEGGYGKAKLLGEQMLNMTADIRKGSARIFNVYGEKSSLKSHPHVVTRFILDALSSRELTLAGDGKQTRDFVHVMDCVDALLALEANASAENIICNIGFGVPVNMLKLANMVVKLTKSSSLVVPGGDICATSPISRTADITKAKRILDWSPKIPLHEGLERTLTWMEKEVKKGRRTA